MNLPPIDTLGEIFSFFDLYEHSILEQVSKLFQSVARFSKSRILKTISMNTILERYSDVCIRKLFLHTFKNKQYRVNIRLFIETLYNDRFIIGIHDSDNMIVMFIKYVVTNV